MLVLHVMADGNAGGGPTVVQTLCEHAGAFGFQSAIVTQKGSHLQHQAKSNGIPVFGMDFTSRTGVLRVRGKLRRLFDRERPAVVHAHGARSALPVALLNQRGRPPLVYTVHGFHYLTKQPWLRLMARRAEQFCIARAACTVFVARADQQLAQRDGLLRRSSFEVIHNGASVAADLVKQDSERQFDLAFIGRLHAQKDPLILPDILVAMRPQKPTMLIVGSGDLEIPLRAKIRDAGLEGQVTMMSAMPRHDALANLSRARLFLLPSLWEGLPITIIEAMLLHVPVIASKIRGNDEIVSHGDTGYLVPARQPAAFAERLSALLASPQSRREVAARASAHVTRKFSIEHQVAAYADVYRSVATA